MKKLTLGIITGIGIAMAAICFICAIVLMNPRFQDDLQANANTGSIVDIPSVSAPTQTETQSKETESQMTEHANSETQVETETQLPVIETESESLEPSNSETEVVDHPYYIKVNRNTCCITVYKKDANGNYTIPVRAMACSVGRNGRTPRGIYHTLEKYTWRELNGGVYGQYSTRVVGGVLFHSVPYSSQNKTKLITNYYNQLGSPASAGCIRLTCADAKWIYDNCAIGVTVEIFDGDASSDPLGKPTTLKLDPESPNAGWDPTDPDADNPWKTVKPVISGVTDKTVERDATGKYEAVASAKDSWGNTLEVKVSGTVNMGKCGKYTLTYSATDCIGNVATQKVTITVVDTKAPVINQTETVVVSDQTSDIEALIRSNLKITDNGEELTSAELTFDLSKLTEAMAKKEYGNITCSVSAKDASGNMSEDYEIIISYIFVEPESETEDTTNQDTEPDGEID